MSKKRFCPYTRECAEGALSFLLDNQLVMGLGLGLGPSQALVISSVPLCSAPCHSWQGFRVSSLQSASMHTLGPSSGQHGQPRPHMCRHPGVRSAPPVARTSACSSCVREDAGRQSVRLHKVIARLQWPHRLRAPEPSMGCLPGDPFWLGGSGQPGPAAECVRVCAEKLLKQGSVPCGAPVCAALRHNAWLCRISSLHSVPRPHCAKLSCSACKYPEGTTLPRGHQLCRALRMAHTAVHSLMAMQWHTCSSQSW